MFSVCSTTSKEADNEADDSNDDDEQSGAVDVIAEECEVVLECCLKHSASNDKHQTDNLLTSASTSALSVQYALAALDRL